MQNLKSARLFRRKLFNLFFQILLFASFFICATPLFNILAYLFKNGIKGVNLDLFTELPKPMGDPHSGFAHAFLGTFILVTIAALIAIPWGILVGTFLSEYNKSKLSSSLKTMVGVLASIPSIVVGLFAYGAFVAPFRHFSTMAGSAALAIIMLPTIAKTTEEILRLVPKNIREAGLALGLPRYRVILSIVLTGSRNGLLTGIMLALARASGETAPLLFTALGSRFWFSGFNEPIAAVPLQVYQYAISPFEEWHSQAWAASLVLVVFILFTSLAARILVAQVFSRVSSKKTR